jgi:hypothetical protein
MQVSFALVHHANQYLITDGYDNREGISDIVAGMDGALDVHERYGIPLNLHISGTLLEAVAWRHPWFLHRLRAAIERGTVELVGSAYGQNIMRFFTPEYNRRQLVEELRLYQTLLGADAARIQVFWPPERVWDTARMAGVLRDETLPNGGYHYVILDDRTLLSRRDDSLPRHIYDQGGQWTPELYQAHEIENGLGLVALPIAIRLRLSIPPRKDEDWGNVQAELESLLVHSADAGEGNLLALYADDLEKVIGVWGAEGPPRYAALLEWLSDSSWIRAVRLSDWLRAHPPAGRRAVETGSFVELAHEFQAGEGYEKWFHSEHWEPYRKCFEETERRVAACKAGPSDAALVELAEKQLLVANWETGWQTPATGAHGNSADHGKPSPWARALTSHCRHALVTAEAACWMKMRDGRAYATVADADGDGEPDLILKNDRFFGLLNARWGGRLVALFSNAGPRGVMVIGNPCDDWNYLEDLNRFMETPRNHPGAFADVGFENDHYTSEIFERNERVCIRLTNCEPRSPAAGLEKTFELGANDTALTVRYRLPRTLRRLSIEFGLSPDYLTLLRRGSEILHTVNTDRARGFGTAEVAVTVEPEAGIEWEVPLQDWIGHGRTLRVGTARREFLLVMRIGRAAADAQGARIEEEAA